MALFPTLQEQQQKREILQKLIECIKSHTSIKLPEFNPSKSIPAEHFSLVSVGIETNPFGGQVQDYRYQFEGEEDLLHLIVTQVKGQELTAEEGQQVAQFLLEGLPPALIWLKPGRYSQHFYFGHDHLLTHLKISS